MKYKNKNCRIKSLQDNNVMSHHSMSAYFSSTDTDELVTNCKHYNYYISLIVNFQNAFVAKIAIPSKTTVKRTFSMKDTDGKYVIGTKEEEVDSILIGDLQIVMPKVEVEEWILNRVEDLKKAKAALQTTKNFVNKFDFGDDDYVIRDFSKYNNNSKSQVDFFPKKKYVSPYEFVRALLALDTESVTTISELMKKYADLSEGELDMYIDGLDSNFEIIHENLFGKNSDIKTDAIEAYKYLHSPQMKDYKSLLIFEVLNDILEEYVIQ